MSRTLHAILRERALLQARSRVLRHRMAVHGLSAERSLGWVDRAQSLARKAWARPALSAALAAVGLGGAIALGPRRALAWGAKGWAAWRLWRNLSGR